MGKLQEIEGEVKTEVEKLEFRLVHGFHSVVENGIRVLKEPGSILSMTQAQVDGFPNKFDPVTAAAATAAIHAEAAVSADEIVAAARTEAADIIAEANNEADKIVAAAKASVIPKASATAVPKASATATKAPATK